MRRTRRKPTEQGQSQQQAQPSLLLRTRSGVLRATQLLTVSPSHCNLTWHKPITTFAEFSDVTSQFVQKALGFAVSVKEPKFGHSTVGFVGMWQIGDLKKLEKET